MQHLPEPSDSTERKLLVSWLAFYRDAFEARCAGLTDDELTLRSAMPSSLSLQGVVRQLTELEHRHLVHAIGGDQICPSDLSNPADLRLPHPGEAQAALRHWREEQQRADALLIKARPTDKCPGNGRSLRWNLMKVVGEYARQLGHADLIRERIDGWTGE